MEQYYTEMNSRCEYTKCFFCVWHEYGGTASKMIFEITHSRDTPQGGLNYYSETERNDILVHS